MAMVLCEGGFARMLNDFVAEETAIKCCLTTRTTTPAVTDTAFDWATSTFTGYADVTLGSWSAATIANPSVINGSTATFTSSADQTPVTITGAYLLDDSGGLIGGEIFAVPVVIQFNGDQVIVHPTLTMAQC